MTTKFLSEVDRTGETTFYDSVTGRPLFVAPRGRSFEDFEKESRSHGWPSFRDEEVVWDDVRVLPDGETVSTYGVHLGHNLPDRKGNRYCASRAAVSCSRLTSPLHRHQPGQRRSPRPREVDGESIRLVWPSR